MIEMINAVVKTLDAGYPSESDHVKSLGWKIGDVFEVSYISIGQSCTNVELQGFTGSFNSVFFMFLEDGMPLDIFSDPRFNHYMKFKKVSK